MNVKSLRVQTASGSVYRITPDRWERIGKVPIFGTDATSGPYNGEPVVMGQRMVLMLDDDHPIHTTPVVEAEVTDSDG